MATHFPVESFGITEGEHAYLLQNIKDSSNINKLNKFKGQFDKLKANFQNNRISYDTFIDRANKLSNRFKGFINNIQTTGSYNIEHQGEAELRQRINPSEGEEIELFNRGGPEASAVDSFVSEGVTEILPGAVESGGVGIVGSTSTTPLIATGVGAIVAGTGAALANKIYHSGIQAPGSKYIGPGNPLDSGKPNTFADADAQQHDLAYTVEGQDISAVDDIAIQQFGDHIVEDALDPHSIIGYGGLQVKKIIESHVGQLCKYGLC